MRMWHRKLTPYLCNRHLNGAYGELFKHRHNFVKKHSVTGRVSPVVQIEPYRMERYFKELRAEKIKRGHHPRAVYTLPDLSYLPRSQRYAKIDLRENIETLKERCPECREKIRRHARRILAAGK